MNIRDATREDAVYVGANLREPDRIELALLGRDASDVVVSFDASDVARTIEHDGKPVAVFGRVMRDTGGAFVWLLATSGLDSVRRGFVLACKPEIGRLRFGCDRLVNITHRDNATVLRWLAWLGFHVEQKPCGPGDEFVMFWMPGA
ncbi:hypothetical protein [Methylibium sp.]|uniref:hypothetical protein n=1 Tax=Methylibium sp. TaxID=2067992 RepID=UPI0017FF08A6|nr:hypothetical protein [Methylibium sp.]MBA3588208.1 hypothetical protein [Methylibium sp.]